MYLHHDILKIYQKVDRFISPSKFLMAQTRKMGFVGDISHIPNFVYTSEYVPSYYGETDAIIYFGRLSREKGIDTLIEAMRGLDTVKLRIIGDGPLSDRLRKKVSESQMNNVSFLGYLFGSELMDEIKKALFIVIPSEWYENNPRSVLEAFALGKAVLGARIGGIPELIEDGVTGMTFAPGDVLGLRQNIRFMVENSGQTMEMGRKARILVENKYSSSQHYDALLKLYTSILR
jgi:glycosyltransferase involved in cell wall biosynthesis